MAAAELARRGHSVTVACRCSAIAKRMTVLTVRWPFASAVDLLTLAPLIAMIRRDKIDVLIPTKRKEYVLAGLAARFTSAVSVMRLGIVRHLRTPWERFVYAFLTDGIIGNARAIRAALLRTGWFNDQRIVIIRNGLDLDRLDRESVTKGEGFTVCSLGLLTPRKGFAALIEGFASFVRADHATDARLVIAGEGDERPRLEALAQRLGVDDKVEMPGFSSEPYRLLASSHVFALLSRNEGVSNAMLEAMYLRCACITSSAGGGAEEIIRHNDNGVLLPPDEPEALASVLRELYHNPQLREKMAEAGRETVRRECAMSRMGDELESFLYNIRSMR